MRNLLEYPVTKEEVLQALKEVTSTTDLEDKLGDLNGYIMERVTEVMKREFRHEDFNPTEGAR